MRALAWTMTLGFLALAGWVGLGVWQDLQTPAPQILAQRQTEGAEPATSQPAIRVARTWPALFGEPQPPAPPEPPAPPAPQPEPQPPRPPKPPLDSLGYALKGMVQAGESTWAMVFHPTGEQLVRAGQMLSADIEVVRIDEAGVWISRGGDAPEVLGFAQ